VGNPPWCGHKSPGINRNYGMQASGDEGEESEGYDSELSPVELEFDDIVRVRFKLNVGGPAV
jgi:hypothetical protein